MTVMSALMPGSSQMQIGTTAKSTGFGGKGINMSRETVLSTSHPSPRTASFPTCFHPPPIALNLPQKPAESCSPSMPPPAESCSTSMPPPSTNSIYQSTTNSTASSSHTSAGACPPAYSGSDDEHRHRQLLQTSSCTDERKQRRMVSNRESARRSRMRKQQHLDDLRVQIVQLRAENNHMLNKFNVASEQYMQVQDENRTLRSYAIDLSRKLQALGIALQQAGDGFDSQFTESIPRPKIGENLFGQI